MKNHNKMKFNQACLILLTLAMCTQRLSIAAGNVLYVLSIVFFTIDTYQRYKAGEELLLSAQIKRYFLVYIFFALTILPSAIFSLNPGYSFLKFMDYFALRFLGYCQYSFAKS